MFNVCPVRRSIVLVIQTPDINNKQLKKYSALLSSFY